MISRLASARSYDQTIAVAAGTGPRCTRTDTQEASNGGSSSESAHGGAHTSLGLLLYHERKDIDGAEAAFRAAIAVNPGFSLAHFNLGDLLKNERKDIDGAEAAFREAIALNPGFSKAHRDLGNLVQHRALRILDSNGDLAAVVARLDECAQLYQVGLDHERAKNARAIATKLRRLL